MDTDNATVVVNKPDSVLMRFYDNDTELVAGSTVKLGHKLNSVYHLNTCISKLLNH